MAATNYTPIQLYYSTTASAAPSAGNLTSGELAINITDGKLYYKDNGGVVQVIATKGAGTIGGSTTQIQYNNAGALAGSAAMTFNSGTNTVTLTTLNLTNALGATYGGTAQSAYAQGDVLYASATNTLSKLGIGTVNYILTSTGSVPQWSAPSSITVQTATNLAGGAGGSVPYQSAADTTTFLAIGAANRVMTSSGSAPQWVTALTGLTGVSSSSITNTSLTATRLVYSSTAGLQADSANLTFDGTTLSATGYSTTGLSTLVKTVTIGNSNFSGTAVFAAATPAKLYIGTGTVTDTTSAIGATNATGAVSSLAITPIAATNTSVTYTNASTLYIAGAPSAGTNVTITNPYALYVAAGNSYFAGTVTFANSVGALTVTSLTDSGLTSGRVTFAGTGGLLSDSANLTWDGTTLSAVGRLYNGSASTFGASTWGMSLGNGGASANYFKAATTYWQNNAGTQILQLSAGSLVLAGSANAIYSGTGTTGWSGFAVDTTGANAIFGVDDSTGSTFGTEAYATIVKSTSKPIYFKNGNTTIGYWSSTGLSVGATSLTAGTKFNVTGNNVTFTPNTAGYDTHTFSTAAADVGTYAIKSGTTNKVYLYAGGTSYFTGGGVAIGSTSASGALDVTGRTYMRASGSDSVITLFNQSGGDGSITATGTASTMNYGFSTFSVSNALYIANGGNVVINNAGTVLDTALLTVSCTAGTGSTTPLSLRVGVDSDGYTAQTFRNQSGIQGGIACNTTSISMSGVSGITFKATQVPSADANTLDDYEEGTWTTTYNAPSNLTGTPTLSQAYYTKIGRLVTVVGKITGYSITSSNTATYPVINLPFPTIANDAAITGSVFAVVGAVYISGVAVDNTGGDANSTALIMPAVSVTTTGTVSIVFTITYQTTT